MGLRPTLLLAAAASALSMAACGESGAPAFAPRQEVTAPVVRVVDGDTIKVDVDGREEYVRYIGVDTPETVDPDEPVGCYGHRASAYNASLVEGETVRLTFDAEPRDRYGRLLAYVHVGNDFVNADLVRGGYARTLTIAPNTAHAGRFARLERAAGRRGRGLWGACPP